MQVRFSLILWPSDSLVLVVGERSDDQSLDSISNIPCEDATCEHATRDVTACEDTVLLPAVGEYLVPCDSIP